MGFIALGAGGPTPAAEARLFITVRSGASTPSSDRPQPEAQALM